VTDAVQTKLEALHALARAAAGANFRARTLLQRICDAVADALDFERVAIFRYDAETETVAPFAAHGADEADVVRMPSTVSLARLPIFRDALDSGRATFSREVDREQALSQLAVALLGIRSLVVVPLMTEGRCLGFLCADRAGKEFRLDHEELELMTTIGAFTAAFLEKAIQQSELRRLNEVKSQFIALASHELRTPAATIFGISATLEQRWDVIPPEDRDELRHVLHQEAQRLRRLVDQLLDLSRVETGAATIEPERCRIREHLEELSSSIAADRRSDVALDVPADLEAVVDPDVFERIISNLLSNAIRYGEPPVVVRARRAADELEVVVEDHGVGVPAEFVPNLFDRFTRATTSERVEGAGIGLAIAQSYARAHGGEIVYEDALPRGARFRVTLAAGV
jgi:two-component system sensor histidine kinase MtrB